MLSRLVTLSLRPLAANTTGPPLRKTVVAMSTKADAPPPAEVTANVEGEGAAQTKSAGMSLSCLLWTLELRIYTAKKEAKRLEKAAKFAAKSAKTPTPAAAAAPAAEKKKPVKETKVEEPPFVNTTPAGQKKGERIKIPSCPI